MLNTKSLNHNPQLLTMKKIGFLVNPIAGMGGSVGLKGTDGDDILTEAIRRGARPVSSKRARQFLSKVLEIKEAFNETLELEIHSAGGAMGGGFLEEFPEFAACFKTDYLPPESTHDRDTKALCRELLAAGVDLVVFCGGDGTARDVFDVVGNKLPILGIPSGVKMHSGVFAYDPRAAALLFFHWLKGAVEYRDAEVMDIDEEAFRQGRLSVKLFGFAQTPYEEVLIQERKAVYESVNDEMSKEEIARYLEELMEEEDALFILGPGTTTQKIAENIGIEKTLLGVDLVKKGNLLAKDVGELEILARLEKESGAKVVVSVIGNQGFIFGRGNQQISAEILTKVGRENLLVVATPQKMRQTPLLRVDTGDPEMDRALAGYIKVIIGYREMRLTKVEVPEMV